MNETTRRQVELIGRITTTLGDGSDPAWLFGGWGLDARIGQVTRDHGDIEFWVDHRAAARVRRRLTDAGASRLDTQPPEESTEYDWDGTGFSTAYFDSRPDGTFASRGRFEDWVFPAGSFPDQPVELAGMRVRAMSVAGMLAMKEQYPNLRHGRPWRDKDVSDIALLRSIIAAGDG